MRNLADGSIVWTKTENLANKLDLSRAGIAFCDKSGKFAYSFENTIVVCESKNGEELKRIPVLSMFYEITNAISGFCFENDGSSIYATLIDGTARKYKL